MTEQPENTIRTITPETDRARQMELDGAIESYARHLSMLIKELENERGEIASRQQKVIYLRGRVNEIEGSLTHAIKTRYENIEVKEEDKEAYKEFHPKYSSPELISHYESEIKDNQAQVAALSHNFLVLKDKLTKYKTFFESKEAK